MISLDGILVDESILHSYFSCNISACKGACCTFPGDFGGPLKEEEIPKIEKCLDIAKEYLSENSKKVLEKQGFYEGKSGKLTTVCINRRDCVFVYYPKGSPLALCALEKAYLDGKTDFRKPISCHLFPIRVGGFGGKYLHYEKIEECEDAVYHGRANKVSLLVAVKDALIREFGEEWYEKLSAYAELENGKK